MRLHRIDRFLGGGGEYGKIKKATYDELVPLGGNSTPLSALSGKYQLFKGETKVASVFSIIILQKLKFIMMRDHFYFLSTSMMWPSFPGWNAFPMTDDKFGFHSLLLATSSIICFQGGGGSGFEKVARIIRKFRVKTGSTCHSGGATWLQAILTPFPDKDKLSYATTCLGSQLRRSFL